MEDRTRARDRLAVAIPRDTLARTDKRKSGGAFSRSKLTFCAYRDGVVPCLIRQQLGVQRQHKGITGWRGFLLP